MNIQCFGNISIVDKKLKPYWYKRKGYYVGDRWVKPKKIRKFKKTPLKTPFLNGYITLLVDKKLSIGGMYCDENNKKYICITVDNISETSLLKITDTNLGKSFNAPTQIFYEG